MFGDFEYEIIGKTQKVRITKYLGKAEIIEIPSTITVGYKKYKVTELGDGFSPIISYSPWDCTIKDVILPETVRVISSYCFIKFFGSRISGPGLNSVITIGPFAFAFSDLTEIEFGPDLNYLGNSAFYLSKYLEKVDLQKTKINNLQENTFFECESLQDLLLPDTLKTICNKAFYGCCSLNELVLPYSVVDFSLTSVSSSFIERIYFNSYPRFYYKDNKELDNLKGRKIYVPESIVDSVKSVYRDLNIYGIESSAIKYEIFGDSAIILPRPDDSGFRNTYSGDFIIPKHIYNDGRFYKVIGMDPFAFSDCKDLVSITVPKSFKLVKDFIDRHIEIKIENP